MCGVDALTMGAKLAQQVKWGGTRHDYDPERERKQFAKQTLQLISMCFEMR